LPLPLVSAAQVNLKRRDDELLVAVADHRRVLSLPSILRRCVVTGAVVRNATLRVRFVPDEKLWPVDERESVAPE
jgi:arsenite-transporting ATPase